MRRGSGVLLLSVVVLACVAGRVGAIPPPMALEDRVADSEVVVEGKTVRVMGDVPTKMGANLVRCEVKVTRVLKGPLDLKKVNVVCPLPPRREAGPDGMMRMVAGPSFRKAQVGAKVIWMLVSHEKGEGYYRELFYHPMHNEDKIDRVAAVVAAAADPLKVFDDKKTDKRTRLSAAYLLLRKAVGPEGLPMMDGVVDMSKHVPVEPAKVNEVIECVIGFIGSMVSDPWPGEFSLARKALYKIGCPVNELRPKRARGRLSKEAQVAERAKWAEAVRGWWAEHKGSKKLYLPKE